ncbi:DUF63 family protein [Candidatus Micrarchaeota archaeon]|nr:DUF63 family protein [Candidatus Micrarchaeota archaeon]
MAFIDEYFVNPIINSTGYNAVNTVAYVLITLVVLYATAFAFRKMKIKTNDTLFYDIAPFVFLGGVLRALQDMHFFASLGVFQYFFVTPLIYILLYAIVFALIVIQKKTKKEIIRKIGYTLLYAFSVPVLLSVKQLDGLMIALALFGIVFGVTYFVLKKTKSKVLNGVNVLPFAGHVLDACSSVTAITIIGGFTEQHVLPNFIFSYIPFYFFIPLKVTIILAALYLIDRDVKNANSRFMLKLALFALGMGPGVRNSLTMVI